MIMIKKTSTTFGSTNLGEIANQPTIKEIKQAEKCLREGKVIGYPTGTVFGLGCDPFNPEAVSQILQIKQRSIDKGFILIASEWEQIQPLIESIAPPLLAHVLSTWPGPITWVFPASHEVPHWIRGDHSTIALRVSDHPIVRMLCDEFGDPIVSTSANIEGQPPINDYRTMQMNFADKLCTILPGKISPTDSKSPKPTEIRDAVTGEVIRPG